MLIVDTGQVLISVMRIITMACWLSKWYFSMVRTYEPGSLVVRSNSLILSINVHL